NATPAENAEAEEGVETPAMNLAQRNVMAWAVRQGAQVYLGPCDRLQEELPGALALEPQDGEGDLRVLVDLPGTGGSNDVNISPDGVVAMDAIQRAVAVDGLAGATTAVAAQGIVNDSACPGNYVMGTVVNAAGTPMPGMRLALTDAWGNQTFAVSK